MEFCCGTKYCRCEIVEAEAKTGDHFP
jgi:hypothetical protein